MSTLFYFLLSFCAYFIAVYIVSMFSPKGENLFISLQIAILFLVLSVIFHTFGVPGLIVVLVWFATAFFSFIAFLYFKKDMALIASVGFLFVLYVVNWILKSLLL